MLVEVREAIAAIIGSGRPVEEVTAAQMAVRALLVYVFTLAIVRLGRKRFLSSATAFDVLLGIMIGSAMSRGINGPAGLGPTMAAGAVLVALHATFAWLAHRTTWFGEWVKGSPVLLVEDSRILKDAMRKTSVTDRDLAEALRLQGIHPDRARIQRAYLERNGRISIIPDPGGARVMEISVTEGVQTVRIEIA